MNSSTSIFLTGDDLHLSPTEITAELARLSADKTPETDVYGLGGIVEEIEAYFARELGKERALFMPTGTLANHLAIRALAVDRRRVLVQDISHIYNDAGDSSQLLSNLNLLPLAPDRAGFSWADVEGALHRTASGRVLTPVGAISIESPVRRASGELFDRANMLDICTRARSQGIGLHLDGARLYIASAYTGISPADYAQPFDTVYVSLWKYFNAMNGAILAGPAEILDGMFHVRRMFGGALFNAWPFALLAREYADGFVDRLKSAITVSEEFINAVADSNISIERVPNGTNVFRLIVAEGNGNRLRERLAEEGVVLPSPWQREDGAVFTLQVNETWNRTSASRLVGQFRDALRD